MAKKKTGSKKTAKKKTAKKKSRVAGISYQKGGAAPPKAVASEDPTAPDHKVSVGFGSFPEPEEAPARAAPTRRAPEPQAAPSRGGGANSEASAVVTILRTLEGLEPSQVERVINAVVEEYAAGLMGRGRAAASEPAPEPAAQPRRAKKKQGRSDDARLGYDALPDFIDGAGVKSPAMRALLCAYWMQLVEGAEDFLPTDLASELAIMNMPVRDIDEAFAALVGKGYVSEIPSQRSTKRFMLTPQGMTAVWELFE